MHPTRKRAHPNDIIVLLKKQNKHSLKYRILPLPLTVREAVEVWLPTVKVTVPESALVTPLSVRLCNRPSILIKFISLFCSGTSWSVHWAIGASSCETRHSKCTSSPSYTTQLSKNFSMLTSTSVWQTYFRKIVRRLPVVSKCLTRMKFKVRSWCDYVFCWVIILSAKRRRWSLVS